MLRFFAERFGFGRMSKFHIRSSTTGTGKTMFAQAFAKENGFAFLEANIAEIKSRYSGMFMYLVLVIEIPLRFFVTNTIGTF